MNDATLYTIGFTQKNAQQFFTILRANSIRRVIDIRLNNVSQLAGFTKRDDLKFFLKELCSADYLHCPECAPPKTLLEEYKKHGQDWDRYVAGFIPMITKRKVESLFDLQTLDRACLLCSEPTAKQCHRRLVAEYLQSYFPGLVVRHI